MTGGTRTELAALEAAEREYRAALRAHRGWAARNRDRITAEWNCLPDTPRTIADHVAAAREAAGEERWAQLNAEWEE